MVIGPILLVSIICDPNGMQCQLQCNVRMVLKRDLLNQDAEMVSEGLSYSFDFRVYKLVKTMK